MWESTHLIYLANQLLALLLLLLSLIWGERLRRARKARRWTTEEAVEQLNNAGGRNIDVRTYLSWERGERQPRPLNRLALQRTFLELNPETRLRELMEANLLKEENLFEMSAQDLDKLPYQPWPGRFAQYYQYLTDFSIKEATKQGRK